MSLDAIYDYFVTQLTTNDFFSGAALATVLASFFYQLKAVPERVYHRLRRKIVFNVHVYEESKLYWALESYMKRYYSSQYRDVEADLVDARAPEGRDRDDCRAVSAHGREEPTTFEIRYSHHQDAFIVWFERKPIMVSKGREKLENASSYDRMFLNSFGFTSVFGKGHIQRFLDGVLKEFQANYDNSVTFGIYTNRWQEWHKVSDQSKLWNQVVLPKSQKAVIVRELEDFLAQRQKYKRLGIPYKRTFLLNGKPGNGKTSLAAAIASYLKRDVFYLNLSTVDGDAALQNIFSSIAERSVLVLEDIDTVFDGRKPIGKITFSALLNCLDGMFAKDDLVTIMTTNHVESLDPALVRKGRVDTTLYLDNPTVEEVREYLAMFYETTEEAITARHPWLTTYEGGISMSDVVGACLVNELDTIGTAIVALCDKEAQ